ncbi:MAG: GDYXXLXY domain-containing protein, partial [Candidatus Omnitrophota bacterium]
MKKNLILGFFAVLFVVQIAVPISMIVKREDTLKYGTTYRFETEPIDPYDAFRGRYVSLWVRVNKVPNLTGAKFEYAEKVYALLVVDEKGFAQVSEVTTRRPEGSHYLTATVASGGSTIALRLPIDRYYMEEGAAPRAEKIY